MDKNSENYYNNIDSQNDRGDNMEALKEKKDLEEYRITNNAKEAWKRSIGSLTGVIPKTEDDESLSEYIERKRHEETKES